MKRLLALALLLGALPAMAAVSAQDGSGQTITLAQPAQRILTLVPHATEMLYAIGAGDKLVATVEYSNHPEAAKRLPRVGSFTGFSLEAVMRQRPDLVVAWSDGGAPRELERVRSLGIPVYLSHPLQPDDVAKEMLALGRLAGVDAAAGKAAASYRQRLADLRQRYGARAGAGVLPSQSDAHLHRQRSKLHGAADQPVRRRQRVWRCSRRRRKCPPPPWWPRGRRPSWPAMKPACGAGGAGRPCRRWPATRCSPCRAMPWWCLARGWWTAPPLCLALDTARQRLGLTAK